MSNLWNKCIHWCNAKEQNIGLLDSTFQKQYKEYSPRFYDQVSYEKLLKRIGKLGDSNQKLLPDLDYL